MPRHNWLTVTNPLPVDICASSLNKAWRGRRGEHLVSYESCSLIALGGPANCVNLPTTGHDRARAAPVPAQPQPRPQPRPRKYKLLRASIGPSVSRAVQSLLPIGQTHRGPATGAAARGRRRQGRVYKYQETVPSSQPESIDTAILDTSRPNASHALTTANHRI